MLICSQSESALVDFSYLPQSGLEVTSRFILDPAIFNEHREVVFAILPSSPTKVVYVSVEKVWSSWRESVTKPFFNFRLEGVKSHAVDGVLQSCVLVQRKNRSIDQTQLSDLDDTLRLQVTLI